MNIYDFGSQQRLISKLDYEIWVLDFLGNSQDLFYGKTDISTIQLTNRQQNTNISVGIQDHIGASYGQQIIDALTPLTFTASYKILDMVYEWILEENESIGVISDVPRGFSKKLKLIKESILQYPPLFADNTYFMTFGYPKK